MVRLVAGDVQGVYDQDHKSGEYWPQGLETDYEAYFTLAPGFTARSRHDALPRCGM